MNKSVVVATAVIAASLSLGGCAAATPAPAPTVTLAPAPAPTITASPLAVTPETPLEPIDAWAICVSFMSGDSQTLNSFGPDTVTENNGVFTVITVGTGDAAGAECTIRGTLGKPVVVDWHTPR
jgi:hypothetical protein